MADPTTTNLDLLLQSTGTASGQWGANLNSLMIQLVDQALGSSQSVPLASSNVTLTMTQRQNLRFALTGTLAGNVSVSLPLVTNSTTQAVGGFFVFDNQTTGAFSVTVKTAVSGSAGVEVPQGVRTAVVSNGTNVTYADDAQNLVPTVSGNPNGSVAGTAGSVSSRASKVIDRATNVEYLCTTAGTASSAVWFPNLPFTFPSQGYLTLNSSTTNVVTTSDTPGATTIYYSALRGGFFFVWNGTSFAPVPITNGQLQLALSGSAQAASGLYDIIGFLDSTTPRIGFSPAWTSAAAGGGSRGTGAGTPQMTRVQGVPVNAVQQTVNNGSTTYIVPANRGTILGTAFIDSTPGQITCHVSWGQSRKWGLWNVYNRLPLMLQVGDPNDSWFYDVGTWRPANNNTANSLTVLSGLPEEGFEITLLQKFRSGNASPVQNGVGWNSTTSPLGTYASNSLNGNPLSLPAFHANPPSLGINTVTALEIGGAGSGAAWFGTQPYMTLAASWAG